MTAVEWADQNYYLPKESSYCEGEWKTLPFQIAIMNCMGNDQVRTVNLIKSARVWLYKDVAGGVGYFIEHKSRNSLLFQPRILPLKIFEVSRGGDDSERAMPERPFPMAGS